MDRIKVYDSRSIHLIDDMGNRITADEFIEYFTNTLNRIIEKYQVSEDQVKVDCESDTFYDQCVNLTFMRYETDAEKNILIHKNQVNKEQELKQLKMLVDKYKDDVLEYLKHD